MSLAAENLRLGYWVARDIRARDADDVRQAALLGLVEAEAAHNPARGRFSGLAAVLARRRAFEELYRQRGYEERETTLSYFAPDGTEEERTELPPVPPPDVEAPLMALRLREELTRLPVREAEVLRLRFGLDGEERTLRAVGDVLGLSGQRIAQLERAALRRLRRALTRKRAARRC